MKFATQQQLEALSRIIDEIIQLSPQLESLCLGTLEVVNHNTALGNLDGALAAGVTAFNHLGAEYNRLMGEFQKAVAGFVGERPAPGESPADFFGRICQLDAEGLQRLARKHGIVFEFETGGGA